MDSLQRIQDVFHRDGYVVIPNAVTAETCAAALKAGERFFYGGPYEDWLRAFDAGQRPGTVPDGIAPMPDGRRSRFPMGDADLDRLIENERVLDASAAILGSEPLFCSAHPFARTGPTDDRFSKDPDGGWHFDHFNGGLLPPSEEPEGSQFVTVALYLHDIGPNDAPTEYFPGSHRRAAAIAAAAHDLGLSETYGELGDLKGLEIRQTPKHAVAPAGSAVIYSSLLIHRARPFRDPRRRRLVWAMSMGSRSRSAFCRSDNPFAYPLREAMKTVVTLTTPRARTLLGWPPPGDAYYGPKTFELLARMFPGIDLAPYRDAAH